MASVRARVVIGHLHRGGRVPLGAVLELPEREFRQLLAVGAVEAAPAEDRTVKDSLTAGAPAPAQAAVDPPPASAPAPTRSRRRAAPEPEVGVQMKKTDLI